MRYIRYVMPLPFPPDDAAGDDRWIVRAQAGEAAAFTPLVDAHLSAIRAQVALRIPVSHLVDEIAHETFVFAYRNLGSFQAGTSFRAWLRAIAANLCRAEIQRFRRQEARRARLLLDDERDEAEDAVRRDTREAELLAECMAALSPELQKLLALKYREERTSDEIADGLQRSAEWVRVTLFRVRRSLRGCIEAKLSQEGSHAG